MSYVKQTWVDRAVEFFRRFSASEDVDGNISLVEEPGVITSAGTPLDASRLNHMEDGIESAHDDISDLADDIDEIKAGGDTDGRFATMPYVGTAPLIEQGGTDTNGYIKHANGTLECFVALSGLNTASTGTKEITWTFAHAFAAGTIPIVTASIGLSVHTQFSIIDKVAVQRAVEGNNTTAKLFYNVAATSGVAFRIHARAIGRWK